MNAPQFFLVASLVVASTASLITHQDALLTSLLKRQEPGTPAYNCHDNCGSAIKLSRVADPCNNAVFIADYNNCLKCSGPDNYNIWRYYGGSLSNTGAKCGLDTEPVSGKQEDVPPAGSTGAAPSATPTQTATIAISSTTTSAEASASAEASVAPTQSSVSGPLSSAAVPTSREQSEAPVFSATTTTVTTSAVPSDAAHSTVVANVTLSSFVAGETSPSSNASASSTASAPAQVTVNSANSLHAEGAASVFGAIFIGAIFGM